MLDSALPAERTPQASSVVIQVSPLQQQTRNFSGFTAVNGTIHAGDAVSRHASDHLAAPRPMLHVAMNHDFNSRRAMDRPTLRAEEARFEANARGGIQLPDDIYVSNKRKRNDVDDSAEHNIPNGTSLSMDASSPKHRTTAPDSGIDMTSPDRQTVLTPVYLRDRSPPDVLPNSQYERARTPVREKDAPGPPPEITAKTAAELAQLQQEVHSSENSDDGPDTSQIEPITSPPGAPSNDTDSGDAGSPAGAADNDNQDPKKRKRGFSQRTKTGCHTCRNRKKKCDEQKPLCANCTRGGFNCLGYGPKNQESDPAPIRAPAAIQAKQDILQTRQDVFQPIHQHNPFPPQEGPRYDHWGSVPHQPPPEPPRPYIEPATDVRQQWAPNHEPWQGQRPPWPPQDPPFHLQERLPPADFQHMAPLGSLPREQQPQHRQHQQHHQPPQHLRRAPPPPPSAPLPPHHHPPHNQHWQPQAWLAPYEPSHLGPSGPPPANMMNGKGAHSAIPPKPPSGGDLCKLTEKEKMLLCKPFRNFLDDVLLHDRQYCREALERYNDATRPSSGVNSAEKTRLFKNIIQASPRPAVSGPYAQSRRMETAGSIGVHTIVESPFKCDYGYNINLGSNVIVGQNCYMQDTCRIKIGNGTIIGPNVRIYGLNASVDPDERNGDQTEFIGGPVTIEENCFIGGDVIIMPFRTIEKNSVVAAGSIVTKNVPANTIVAGIPARPIRTITACQRNKRFNFQIERENSEARLAIWQFRGYRE